MGLDAVVFCDCVEKNRLKVPHPFPKHLCVESNGSPGINSEEPDEIDKHDEWMALPPCEHDEMIIAGFYLGNATLVQHVHNALEALLRPPLPGCPVLLNNVLYSGTHAGDYLSLPQVRELAVELQQLEELDLETTAVSSESLRIIKSVAEKLRSLTKIALEISKPIAF